MPSHDEHEERETREFFSLAGRYVRAWESIAASIALIAKTFAAAKPNRPTTIGVDFGKYNSQPEATEEMAPSNNFTAPDLDTVPYVINPNGTDANGAPASWPADAVFSMLSSDSNSLVTPDPSDPSGKTGSISCAAGFAGSVSGTISETDSEGGAGTGSWSGSFQAGSPMTIEVDFSAPVAPAPPATPPVTPAPASEGFKRGK